MESIAWLLEFAWGNEKLRLSQDESSAEYHEKEKILETLSRLSMHIPEPLVNLSSVAVHLLSYFMNKKMSGEDKILGHELICSLHLERNQSPTYLQSFDELERSEWLELTPDSDSQMKLRPWCWLQARVEMGRKIISVSEVDKACAEGYMSNEEYIDSVIEYIQQFSLRLSNQNQTLCGEDVHQLPVWMADLAFDEIETRLKLTKVPVPAAEIRTDLKLSGWQYLFLMGMLGRSEKVIKYDYCDINDVVKLFASSYNVRRMMREHLIGKDSPLVKNGLIEKSDDLFGPESKPTSKAIRLLTGKKNQSRSIEEIRAFVSKETSFDFERPKMKHNALLLPAKVMESIRSIIHAEKPVGRKLRAVLQKNFPSAVGSPTGSTILLYGPPGTGKTLAALYLASELHVPILKVDCSKIISKYVGEDEKNTKRIFDDYASIYKMLKKRPVLLLNEADQLLGQRFEPRGSADRGHNNMQNIFLESLERFDGILVATTNRKEFLDEAYSRRFTYKLELLSPDASGRRKLWESHLPQDLIVGHVDMDKLAAFPLTGGEIRLVLEQAIRKAAFNGLTKLDGALLIELADKETVASKGRPMNKIGFGVA